MDVASVATVVVLVTLVEGDSLGGYAAVATVAAAVVYAAEAAAMIAVAAAATVEAAAMIAVAVAMIAAAAAMVVAVAVAEAAARVVVAAATVAVGHHFGRPYLVALGPSLHPQTGAEGSVVHVACCTVHLYLWKGLGVDRYL